MDDRRSDVPPPANGGDSFFEPLGKPPMSDQPTTWPPQPSSQALLYEPAIAAMVPANPTFSPYRPRGQFSSTPHYFPQNPDISSPLGGFAFVSYGFDVQANGISLGRGLGKPGFCAGKPKPSVANQQEHNIVFGSFGDVGNVLHDTLVQKSECENSYLGDKQLNGFQINSIAINGSAYGNSTSRGHEERDDDRDDRGNQARNGNYRAVAQPQWISGKTKNVGNRNNTILNKQLESPWPPASVLALDIKESTRELHGENELDDLVDRLVSSLRVENEPDEKKTDKKKEYRYDSRGQWIMGQRMRNLRRQTLCRRGIDRLNAPFLAVFESLIPADEEKVKQKQLLTVLEKLVNKEWPDAQLHLYGSCANSFGLSKSDIDVCLTMENNNLDKCEVLLKLADILQKYNLQNVQALTRARVPVVKLMDPVTGISCDICVNNFLAVVNTKLLQNYAKIDVRLRQLVFIVKHWAKSRRVNETYQGTLSSYAYVLMCINFLQQRRPAILPCLQRMETTYYTKVQDVECAYFDHVEKLCNFGAQNRESIAQLVWAFFHYWAYCHDYTNDVISVRMGGTLSKRAKDWTRRIGNDRHLICIEDPFEVSHDLGRVVDKYSVRVLREEFERAADIMQNDPNPFVTLFQPYIPN